MNPSTDSPRYPRDLRGHGRQPPHAQWPGGARVALQFVLNYEEGGENSVLHGDAGSEQFLSEMFNPAAYPALAELPVEPAPGRLEPGQRRPAQVMPRQQRRPVQAGSRPSDDLGGSWKKGSNSRHAAPVLARRFVQTAGYLGAGDGVFRNISSR